METARILVSLGVPSETGHVMSPAFCLRQAIKTGGFEDWKDDDLRELCDVYLTDMPERASPAP